MKRALRTIGAGGLMIAVVTIAPAARESLAADDPKDGIVVAVKMSRADDSSRAVANARVELMDSEGRSWSALSADDGIARFGDARPAGELVLAAQPPACGHALARRLELQPGETTVTLDLGPVRSVSIRVVEPSGRSEVPVPGAAVELQAEGRVFVQAAANSDANGRVGFGCVPRGARVRVRASVRGRGSVRELRDDGAGRYVIVLEPGRTDEPPLEGWRWFPKFG